MYPGALGLPAAAPRAGGGAGPAAGAVLAAAHSAARGARQVRAAAPAPRRRLPAPLNAPPLSCLSNPKWLNALHFWVGLGRNYSEALFLYEDFLNFYTLNKAMEIFKEIGKDSLISIEFFDLPESRRQDPYVDFKYSWSLLWYYYYYETLQKYYIVPTFGTFSMLLNCNSCFFLLFYVFLYCIFKQFINWVLMWYIYFNMKIIYWA